MSTASITTPPVTPAAGDACPHSRSRRTATIAATVVVATHASLALLPVTGSSPAALVAFFVLWLVRGLGITVGYHRLLAHRALGCGPRLEALLAGAGALALQGGPIWWVGVHRNHHAHADRAGDVHSPRTHGFLESHLGWMFRRSTYARQFTRCDDLRARPALRFLNRHAFAVGLSPIPLLAIVGSLAPAAWGTSALQMVVWGFSASLVLF